MCSALAKEGLFDIVKNILKHDEESVRLSGYLSLSFSLSM